ncbi:hypothetical protein HRI_001644300 [Hibiscus trionum]|uniref:D-fructose-1,6-bisphosphate 1-phosphohydrolase n=1 Tax=Hibiscus trionum TaxID=183268 RepID=A0A9W7HPR8_HIBTR|nr:hypothetical protein HRI_001644300 [Hibiscus trionum]
MVAVAAATASSQLLISSSRSLSRLSPFQLCVFDSKTLVSCPTNGNASNCIKRRHVRCMVVGAVNVQGEDQKKLDVVSNEVFCSCLKSSGRTWIIASEEEDVPVAVEESYSGNYIVVFDPLDGSSNIDAAVSTGSILKYTAPTMNAYQMLMKMIPPLVQQNKDVLLIGKPYSARYIGSLVGDFHRTLLYGGIYVYPRDKKSKNGKLRLLYECAPMSFIVEQAGGKGSDGHQRILDIQPVEIHQRVLLYIGSQGEVEKLKKYLA